MAELDMVVEGGIPSLPRKVFEKKELVVLFVPLKRLALRSFQVHDKSRTNLAR